MTACSNGTAVAATRAILDALRHHNLLHDAKLFFVMGDQTMKSSSPQLLEACAKADTGVGGGDFVVDVDSTLIRALPGEILFILQTSSRGAFVDGCIYHRSDR